MGDTYLDEWVSRLKRWGVEFEVGLADAEVAAAEERYGFRFPPDLRAHLQHAIPVSGDFPDWRDGSEEELREMLAWPADGICFDIEHNAFWLDEWGAEPDKLSEASQVARRHIAKAPVLIPVKGHRYLPGEPCEAGNPVLSVWQTDVIPYGYSLIAFWVNEFKHHGEPYDPSGGGLALPPRAIRFWGDLVELNGGW